ncbi:hypothetical protein ACFOUP_15035 [Belliella kenyensis]|uniref:Agarase n=1 Tax=Belliella kenyensis TaxID=1472724 RepID=A0ABV8EP74_9BACT|nr:hypothetical protein [Belliella kenyensis]MCH7403361.1 hypothetical protein [Belliella kenyensis]MDN3601573.1 hypothetical protein [Belliella kenyensis]
MNHFKYTLTIILITTVIFGVQAQDTNGFYEVKARKNADDTVWGTYQAKTVDHIPALRKKKKTPVQSKYGGWEFMQSEGTGFFRTEKIDNRWWIIDPDGYPFIHKGVAVFRPGKSEKQRASMKDKYNDIQTWAEKESTLLKEHGFNGTGAWSDVDLLRQVEDPLVYTVIVNPMGNYKTDHIKKYGGEYKQTGWQGFRFDLIMVFDPEFDEYVDKAIAPISKYAEDKHLLGYYTDNELPWKNDALDRHLMYLAKDEYGYLAAKAWLDERKGKNASIDDVNDDDRLAFTAFYFEEYISKVSAAIKKYDPNHMFLGCRFNQEKEELQNPAIFEVAGKYIDIISVNHYRKWEPDLAMLENWEKWSGKPFIITEWYVKGEDSGLPNRTGAGWNVPSQKDRGIFYQNFAMKLLESKSCVGWHWFTYQDNDPLDLTTDYSNRDSNKGIVDSEFNAYKPLMESMKTFNNKVIDLIQIMDN